MIGRIHIALTCRNAAREQREAEATLGHRAGAELVADRVRARIGHARTVGQGERGIDDAPLEVGHRRGLAQVDRLRVVHRVGRIRGQVLVAQGDRVVDDAVAVVIDAVARRIERAGVDLAGVAALVRRVTAVATARGVPVAVGIDVLVGHPVAVVVDVVAADFADGDDLAHAVAPHARGQAHLGAARARPDTLGVHVAGVAIARLARIAGARPARISDTVIGPVTRATSYGRDD